jgi:hypothetical protein
MSRSSVKRARMASSSMSSAAASPAISLLTVRTLRAERLIFAKFASVEEVVRSQVFSQAQEIREAAWNVRLRLAPSNASSLDDLKALFVERKGTVVRSWAVRHTMALMHHEDVGLAAAALGCAARFNDSLKTWTGTRTTPAPPDETLRRAANALKELVASSSAPVTGAAIVEHLARTVDAQFRSVWSADVTAYAGLVHRAVAKGDAILAGKVGAVNTFGSVALHCRTPPATIPDAEAVLRSLSLRFVERYGPVTMPDVQKFTGFGKLSELTGIFDDAVSKGEIVELSVAGRPHWCTPAAAAVLHERQSEGDASNQARLDAMPVCLLPAFDAFTIAFADKSFFFTPTAWNGDGRVQSKVWAGSAIVRAVVFFRGFLVGHFKWSVANDSLDLAIELWPPLDKDGAVMRAIETHANEIAPWFGVSSAKCNFDSSDE